MPLKEKKFVQPKQNRFFLLYPKILISDLTSWNFSVSRLRLKIFRRRNFFGETVKIVTIYIFGFVFGFFSDKRERVDFGSWIVDCGAATARTTINPDFVQIPKKPLINNGLWFRRPKSEADRRRRQRWCQFKDFGFGWLRNSSDLVSDFLVYFAQKKVFLCL